MSKAAVERKKAASATGRMTIPEYLWSEGLLEDEDWVESYIRTVLSWPKSCTLSVKERHLIGLAKAIAYLWEPGVLIHVDQALEAGASWREINGTARIAAVAAGLSDLENSLQAWREAVKRDSAFVEQPVRDPKVSRLLRSTGQDLRHLLSAYGKGIMADDPDWLEGFIKTVEITIAPTSLKPRTQLLACVAVSAIRHWRRGLKLYSSMALKNGTTSKEVRDVVKSVFKTAVSTAMQVGFRCPCYVPDMRRYRLIADYYHRSRARREIRSNGWQTKH